MLINLSEVFTLEGKEKTWEVPFEAKAYKGTRVEYPVVSANPVKITVKNLGNRHYYKPSTPCLIFLLLLLVESLNPMLL